MTDLADFLRARYAERRVIADAAHAADPAPWTAATSEPGYTNQRGHDHGSGLLIAADGEPMWDCEGSSTLCMTAASSRHAATHHPLDAIADLDAKLAIVDDAESANRLVDAIEYPDGYDVGRKTALGDTLKLLALPYSDHPDYRQEWTP